MLIGQGTSFTTTGGMLQMNASEDIKTKLTNQMMEREKKGQQSEISQLVQAHMKNKLKHNKS